MHTLQKTLLSCDSGEGNFFERKVGIDSSPSHFLETKSRRDNVLLGKSNSYIIIKALQKSLLFINHLT
jgi:hypothetical protein